MPNKEDVQHDLLLIITVAVVILFATGLAKPAAVPGEPIVVP